ncbi:MAG: MaoC family dehydratase [Halioglobus sp.]
MTVKAGDVIPPWEMPSVSAARMRTMAAILRDPNPVHWDRKAVAALPLGLGERTINQGPLGLSYIVNMLHAWAGAGSICKLIMRFPQVVLDGECVVARGEVTEITFEKDDKNPKGSAHLAHCSVRLEHAERGVLLEGSAIVKV